MVTLTRLRHGTGDVSMQYPYHCRKEDSDYICRQNDTTAAMKIFYIISGSLCLALGAIGIFLPLLPTVPFLLLAAFLYCRGSEKLYVWLTGHRIFGRYISEYRENRAMPLKAKVISLALLWTGIPAAMIFHVPCLWGELLLGAVLAGVTIYILSLKTA